MSWSPSFFPRRAHVHVPGAGAGLLAVACVLLGAGCAEAEGVAATNASEAAGGSCVGTMTEQTLANRAFAFDGTVQHVSVPGTAAADDDVPDYPVAQFQVHEWFVGGSEGTVSVKMQRQVSAGDRLLVSGQPLFGGEPLDDPVAWECGFTAEHSPSTERIWRSAW